MGGSSVDSGWNLNENHNAWHRQILKSGGKEPGEGIVDGKLTQGITKMPSPTY